MKEIDVLFFVYFICCATMLVITGSKLYSLTTKHYPVSPGLKILNPIQIQKRLSSNKNTLTFKDASKYEDFKYKYIRLFKLHRLVWCLVLIGILSYILPAMFKAASKRRQEKQIITELEKSSIGTSSYIGTNHRQRVKSIKKITN